MPLGDSLYLHIIVDWCWLTWSSAPVSFTPKCAYVNSPNLAIFTCGIDLFFLLGVLLILLYNFIHETEKMKNNCIFPLAWANWEYYSPPLQNVSFPQATNRVSAATLLLLHW